MLGSAAAPLASPCCCYLHWSSSCSESWGKPGLEGLRALLLPCTVHSSVKIHTHTARVTGTIQLLHCHRRSKPRGWRMLRRRRSCKRSIGLMALPSHRVQQVLACRRPLACRSEDCRRRSRVQGAPRARLGNWAIGSIRSRTRIAAMTWNHHCSSAYSSCGSTCCSSNLAAIEKGKLCAWAGSVFALP